MLLNKIQTHLWELANSVELEPVLPVYSPLKAHCVLLMREWCQALSEHTASGSADHVRLNRDLITAAMEFNQRWDDWISALRYPDLPHVSTKVFHEMLLRFSKGAVKAWRCWLIDLRK